MENFVPSFFIDGWYRTWNHFALMDSSGSISHVSMCKNTCLLFQSPGMWWGQFWGLPSCCRGFLHIPYFVCGKKGVMDEAFIHLENPLIFIKSRCLSLGISLFSKTEWYYIACFLYEFSVFLFIWQSKCQNLTFRQNVPSVSLPCAHPTPDPATVVSSPSRPLGFLQLSLLS